MAKPRLESSFKSLSQMLLLQTNDFSSLQITTYTAPLLLKRATTEVQLHTLQQAQGNE